MKLLELVGQYVGQQFKKLLDGTLSVYNSLRLGGKTLATIESERDTAISDYVTAQKGIANGIAPLDANAQVPMANLPSAIQGGLNYQGTYDASTGSLPASPVKGHFYIISVQGTLDGTLYRVGDWLVYDGTGWDKVDNATVVSSVFGRTGAVVLLDTDVTAVIGTFAEFQAALDAAMA